MRSIRPIAAAMVTTVALAVPLVGSTADAQRPPAITLAAACDEETGDYLVTTTVENFIDEEATIDGGYGWQAVTSGTADGVLEFDQTTLDLNDSATASNQVPGDTVRFDVGVDLTYSDFIDPQQASLDMAGTCGDPATPTTPPPTTPPTTPDEPDVVTRPQFTG